MTDKPRPYRMQRRAESQQRTRARITESAVALHGTVGPSKTTMSAVAEHAGVRRSTLYRHFPDEAALFDACTAHWAATNPPPDPGVWQTINDPSDRLLLALDELYTFYARTEQMLENLFRDEAAVPLVRERFAAFHAYFAAARDTLMRGRKLRGAPRLRTQAAIAHAIAFSTWKSLVREQKLNEADAILLVQALVAAGPGHSRHQSTSKNASSTRRS
jgi:AcrR family transcriptional regulator